ncbi:hypothetical protein Zm00014a_008380, partial [Zea mays]
LASLLAVY